MFDPVSTPHEVGLVKKGTRAALAGWFLEEHFQKILTAIESYTKY